MRVKLTIELELPEECSSFSRGELSQLLNGPPIRVIMTTSDKHGRTVYLSKEDEEFNHKYLGRFGK